TSPNVGFKPYVPQNAAGILIEPPWSPPNAMSTSPAATAAAEPDEEPPVKRVTSCGLRGRSKSPGTPEPHALVGPFMLFLPITRPPAASTRLTTVASKSGMYPSIPYEPRVRGTPATAMWSLKLTVFPTSGPELAPSMTHFQSQALSGSS